MSDQDREVGHPAGLGRRLGAMLYDALLLIGIVATVVAIAVLALGDALSPYVSQPLVPITYLVFYGIFWSRQGQTLGMVAWRLRVVTTDGHQPGLGAILVRLAIAPISLAAVGVGYLWIYTNSNRQTWHGLASNTMVVHIPKQTAER